MAAQKGANRDRVYRLLVVPERRAEKPKKKKKKTSMQMQMQIPLPNTGIYQLPESCLCVCTFVQYLTSCMFISS